MTIEGLSAKRVGGIFVKNGYWQNHSPFCMCVCFHIWIFVLYLFLRVSAWFSRNNVCKSSDFQVGIFRSSFVLFKLKKLLKMWTKKPRFLHMLILRNGAEAGENKSITMFHLCKQTCTQILELFWQGSFLTKITPALFAPSPSIMYTDPNKALPSHVVIFVIL